MRKILHISKYYPPYFGGIEDVCHNIVEYMREKSQQMVICFNTTKTTTFEKSDNIEIIRVGTWRKISSQPISIRYRQILANAIADFKPDIIHFHVPNPLVSFLLLQVIPSHVKLIVHWHSDIVEQKRLYFIAKPLEKKLLKRANKIIAISPPYIEYSKPLQQFRDKITIIQNIISRKKLELTPYRIEEINKIKARYNNKPLILFIGRHVTYKGLEYLIDAIPNIQSKCEILICGRGPLTENLINKNKSDFVHFLGYVPHEELACYLYAADIFAFPSITKNEAFGVALAEAMYCNTPAITFTINGSGVNWVSLNEKTGLEVPNKDSKAFAQAIDRILTNPELKNELARNARERVESLFVIDKIAPKIDDLYN